MFSVTLWTVDEYYYYAGCIFVVSVATIIITLVEMMSNNARVRRMALYSCDVKLRCLNKDSSSYELVDVTSGDLVPGDIIEIPEGKILPCDLVLFTGNAIANEAMLTGESIPVLKT